MPLNKWGAYICEACWNNRHHGIYFYGICDCTCDGKHDSKGNLLTTLVDQEGQQQ